LKWIPINIKMTAMSIGFILLVAYSYWTAWFAACLVSR
jgi:hypothetical protein